MRVKGDLGAGHQATGRAMRGALGYGLGAGRWAMGWALGAGLWDHAVGRWVRRRRTGRSSRTGSAWVQQVRKAVVLRTMRANRD